MIKSIKPGLLAGKSDNEIEHALESLMDCPVEYFEGTIKIRCFDQYQSVKKMAAHFDRLTRVGSVFWGCDRVGPFVGLHFNHEAMRVISGERLSEITSQQNEV